MADSAFRDSTSPLRTAQPSGASPNLTPRRHPTHRLARALAPRLADALSFFNLLCGALSIVCASQQRLDWCLVLLGLGALFDGLDGAAARRFGGSRFGVLADDVADGVNYGLAPASAIYWTIGGTLGAGLGVLYASLVLARLLFFTWNQQASDPRYFQGAPSTIGGVLVLCALILFPKNPLLLGFTIALACLKMVAFSSQYRHIGRFLSEHRRVLAMVPVAISAVLLVALFRGPTAAAGLVLGASTVYGCFPDIKRFMSVALARRSTPAPQPPIACPARTWTAQKTIPTTECPTSRPELETIVNDVAFHSDTYGVVN